MKRSLTVSLLFAVLALTLTGPVAATTEMAVRADQLRTVYFSAHLRPPRGQIGMGAAVTNLTAADLTVTEGGKRCDIASLQLATAVMQVSILVDDAGSGMFQPAVAQFLEATQGHALVAVSVVKPQLVKVTTYTDDAGALKAGLGQLGKRERVRQSPELLAAAIAEAAKGLQQLKAARPVIFVLTSGGTTDSPRALNEVRSSGAALNVLHFNPGSWDAEHDRVLANGPEQSGGMVRWPETVREIGPAMSAIADHLMHQYVLTYTIPANVRSNTDLSLTTSRKDVYLIAPSRLPDQF